MRSVSKQSSRAKTATHSIYADNRLSMSITDIEANNMAILFSTVTGGSCLLVSSVDSSHC